MPEVGRSRREKLESLFTSVADFADTDLKELAPDGRSTVSGIGVDMLMRLHTRAQLQTADDPVPLLLDSVDLPANERELFFDVETDPMRGVCYLHGFIVRDRKSTGTEEYFAFFADDPTEDAERTAFDQAWDFVQANSQASVYVYSPYERTTWKHLSAKYPEVASEKAVLKFFAQQHVVDLYHDVVRSRMEWPTYSYGIKSIATFLGFNWRDPEPSGTSAVRWYHDWVASKDETIKQRILDYNEDDCLAMRVLVDYLIQRT